jgi:type IV pilus assembly protein PilW
MIIVIYKNNTPPMKIRSSHLSASISSGYSLVELLVAMVIGLFLLTGAYQITQVNKTNNILQKAVEQTQKDGRFAINHISYAIKTAGYSGFYGHFTTGAENLLNTPADDRWDISIPVSGFNNVANGATIVGITDFVANTDVLLLKGMNTNTVPVIDNADSATLAAATDSAFTAGDIVVVSDVDQTSLFRVGTVSSDATTSTLTLVSGAGTPGNSALLDNSYNSEAEIAKYDVQMFYIKNGSNGSPALFKANIANTGGVVSLQENELVSDIKDMQISFGIDNDNDQVLDVYRNASAVTDWSQIASINLVLLANSNKDNIVPEKTSFSFDVNLVSFVQDATASTDADRRLKRVFRTYAPLRN